MKIRSASPRLTLNARGAKGLPLPHRHRDTNSVAEFHTPLWRPVEDQTGLGFHCARDSQAVI